MGSEVVSAMSIQPFREMELLRILEGVVTGFLDSYVFKFGAGKLLEDAVCLYRKVFCRWNKIAEGVKCIQVHEIKAVEQICLCECIELAEVADHAGNGVDGTADGDLDDVVVSVAVGVVALAVGGAVFFVGVGGRV